ncbi:MAG: UDP-3-O-acyl-N-acetylglucosamine deacetylase [Pseudobdellovibrionaceae bacterium]
MMQTTLAKDVVLTGVGVHRGADTYMRIRPAAADTGITFIRTDITTQANVIPVRPDAVVDTRLCTVIGNAAGVTVSTIEHLMAALRACDIDNAIVELDGPEVPILDGSSRPFIRAIDSVGVTRLSAPRTAIRILKTVTVKDGDKYVTLSPSETSSFEMTVAFDRAVIGRQTAYLDMMAEDFETEISEARTFGFLEEVEYLRSQGLAKGGSLDNAVVIDGDTIMNQEGLRFDNEFARHKLLDAVGDLYVAGMPILGHYEGYKGGHALNNQILRALLADKSAYEITTMNAAQSHTLSADLLRDITSRTADHIAA